MALLLVALGLSLIASIAHAASTPVSALSSLHHRAASMAAQIPISCYTPAQDGQPCGCPIDLNYDEGVLINFFPGYQCAYPGGACTWTKNDGALQNTHQTNCPTTALCPNSGCTCQTDLNGDDGFLINTFTGYQCAFPGGACTWDFDGVLQNTHQTNCPSSARCLVGN